MTGKEAIAKIKALLGLETIETKFSTSTLQDGTVISYDELAEGQVVSKVLEDGSTEDMEPGEYTLEDGTVIVVGEGSKITEIKEADVETEQEEDEPTDEPTGEPDVEDAVEGLEEIKTAIDEILIIITEVAEEMKAMKADFTNVKTDFTNVKTEFSNRLDEVEKSPSEDPLHFNRENVKPMSVLESRSRALDALKK
jgi:hypothetical protein